MLNAVIAVVAAYLWASVPSAYLVGRYLKGIDIRSYGSGNLGASNVTEQINMRTGLLLGVFDSLAKGTLPVIVARALDQDPSVQAAAGVAAIAGHNWSLYIRFTGGRGLATAFGVVLGLFLWAEMAVLLVMVAFGRYVLKDTALWALVGVLVLPGLALIRGEPTEIVYMLVAVVILLLLKRLTANWEPPRTEQHSLPRVMAYRLLWDRDVSRKDRWTARSPSAEREV
jgi:glycerol-3-phosphate acyltransferase PlsY